MTDLAVSTCYVDAVCSARGNVFETAASYRNENQIKKPDQRPVFKPLLCMHTGKFIDSLITL